MVPSTKYRTIVADPPWEYDSWPIGRGVKMGRRLNIPYSTMSLEAIANLPVREMAEKDAHLYLWTTQAPSTHRGGR